MSDKDNNLGLHFKREKPKKKYKNWYELFKEQYGRGSLEIDTMGIELGFGELEIRELDANSTNNKSEG